MGQLSCCSTIYAWLNRNKHHLRWPQNATVAGSQLTDCTSVNTAAVFSGLMGNCGTKQKEKPA